MAAAATFHGFTAHYLAHDVARLAPGVTCLVHAASGGIGQILIQLAKHAGARVFATTSTNEKAEVRGADVTLLYEDGRFADAIREATHGVGVDVVFDSIGKATLRDSFRAPRRRGLVINYGSVSGSIHDLDPIELGEAGSLFLTRTRLADHLPHSTTIRRRADEIFSALLDGSRELTIGGYTFETVEKAHSALEDRRMIGKPLLTITG
jgi:NADPH2:quinone reductase